MQLHHDRLRPRETRDSEIKNYIKGSTKANEPNETKQQSWA